MVYDSLYPFGYERHDLHTANIVRQVAFGAVVDPPSELTEYLTIAHPQPSKQKSIKQEQDNVSLMLDVFFG